MSYLAGSESMAGACGEVVLRDIRKRDIDDYERWFTRKTEWTRWDAPWKRMDETEAERYIARLRQRVEEHCPPSGRRYEIYCGGSHVGWVSSYFMDEQKQRLAVGINIPEDDFWGMGIGRKALAMFVSKLFEQGFGRLFCQTWSGNKRMMRLAASVGFALCADFGSVTVRGEEYRRLAFVIHNPDEPDGRLG